MLGYDHLMYSKSPNVITTSAFIRTLHSDVPFFLFFYAVSVIATE